MITHGNEIKLFAGNSNRPLAEAIAAKLNTALGAIEVGKFSDGETSVHIAETVRGRDLFIIQSTSTPVNDNLMELLIMIDAAKRASAGRITAVMPYFGYARQDRKARSRDPITAKLVADLLTSAGADRVLTTRRSRDFLTFPWTIFSAGPRSTTILRSTWTKTSSSFRPTWAASTARARWRNASAVRWRSSISAVPVPT